MTLTRPLSANDSDLEYVFIPFVFNIHLNLTMQFFWTPQNGEQININVLNQNFYIFPQNATQVSLTIVETAK